jgi:hypothetical protein
MQRTDAKAKHCDATHIFAPEWENSGDCATSATAFVMGDAGRCAGSKTDRDRSKWQYILGNCEPRGTKGATRPYPRGSLR